MIFQLKQFKKIISQWVCYEEQLQFACVTSRGRSRLDSFSGVLCSVIDDLLKLLIIKISCSCESIINDSEWGQQEHLMMSHRPRTLTWFRHKVVVSNINVWFAVRPLLSPHGSQPCRNIVPGLCGLHSKVSESNKRPHIAVKPDDLYHVVIVRVGEPDVLQLRGVKVTARQSVSHESIWEQTEHQTEGESCHRSVY